VPVAAALALLKKADRLGAGVDSGDPLQPDSAAPSSATAAGGRRRELQN
jgi:hypothetical protein